MRHFIATVDHEGWPLVELEIDVDDGRAVCERIQFTRREDGDPLTASSIRKVRIADATRWAVFATLMEVETLRPAKGKDRGLVQLTQVSDDDRGQALITKAIQEARRRPTSRRSPTDEDRAKAVKLFTVAKRQGVLDPATSVGEQMGFSRATVYRLLKSAHDQEGT
jgi:hypothetical protein